LVTINTYNFSNFTSSAVSTATSFWLISLGVVCELKHWKRKHSLQTVCSNYKNVFFTQGYHKKKNRNVSPLILHNLCHILVDPNHDERVNVKPYYKGDEFKYIFW